MKITPSDICGVAGILPTPATPDADKWQTDNSVNFSETSRMTDLVVEAGTDIILTTGTFGECATLTGTELKEFVSCVVDTVARRRLVFAGVTTLNTRDTIRRGQELVKVGADGLFIGRPMWLAMDDRAIVRFYKDIAEALPGVPVIVYDNPIAFKGKISREAYLQIAAIPEMVAAKHVGGPSLESDALAVGENCRILPLLSDWLRMAKAHPDLMKAAWTGSIACAPSPLNALARHIRERDWDAAAPVSEKCQWAEAAMFAGGDLAKFMDYSIQIGHLRFASAGLIVPGPSRPPYLDLPDEYRAGAIECGQRWASLEKEFGSVLAAT
ncbi:MAG: dihydrodipicolinate synthase family protein [Pseudomonadota bacterium]